MSKKNKLDLVPYNGYNQPIMWFNYGQAHGVNYTPTVPKYMTDQKEIDDFIKSNTVYWKVALSFREELKLESGYASYYIFVNRNGDTRYCIMRRDLIAMLKVVSMHEGWIDAVWQPVRRSRYYGIALESQ